MTALKTAARTTRRVAATAIATDARRASKRATARVDEPKLYKIHSLEEMEFDTRVRRLDPLDEEGARELTEHIQRTSVRLWLLVTEAHDRKAHLALGYETWADYVKAELSMSESRSYQYLDTGHVMKAIASAGVDVETMAPPPTRVVARVKDRLTEVRKAAETAVKQLGDGDLEDAVDKSLRSLAREPRPAARGRRTQTPTEEVNGTNGAVAAAAEGGPQVKCPACGGTGKVTRPTASRLRDMLAKIRSS